MMSGRNDPKHVAVSKSKGITIEWGDGRRSHYSLKYLRDRCPCATCTGAHGPAPEASPFPILQPALKIVAVEPVGNYAIRIRWSDGHSTGIYSYDYLRTISPE